MEVRYPQATMLKFAKLKDPVCRKANWLNYRHSFVSEIEAQDCGFLLEDPIVPFVGMSKTKVDG